MVRAVIDLPDVRDSALLARWVGSLLAITVAYNRAYLRARPETPRIYRSGVVFRGEPWAGSIEQFCPIEPILRSGWGDCAQLCCWRAAELQVHGDPKARLKIIWRGEWPEQRLFHVQVRHGPTRLFPRGRIEDISRYLDY